MHFEFKICQTVAGIIKYDQSISQILKSDQTISQFFNLIFDDFFPFSPTAPPIGPILSRNIYRGDDMMFEQAFGLGCPNNSNRHPSPQACVQASNL